MGETTGAATLLWALSTWQAFAKSSSFEPSHHYQPHPFKCPQPPHPLEWMSHVLYPHGRALPSTGLSLLYKVMLSIVLQCSTLAADQFPLFTTMPWQGTLSIVFFHHCLRIHKKTSNSFQRPDSSDKGESNFTHTHNYRHFDTWQCFLLIRNMWGWERESCELCVFGDLSRTRRTEHRECFSLYKSDICI